jgi:hypothetical protein
MKLVLRNTFYASNFLLLNTQETFEVLTTVKMTMLLYWAVTPCRLIGRYQSFGEIHLSSSSGLTEIYNVLNETKVV